METIAAINGRRSIRKFDATPISREDIERIILAGTQAPSAKNRQPWRFVVVEGGAKTAMLHAMYQGLVREENTPQLPDSAKYISGVRHTITIMEQAPTTIFIINPLSKMDDFPRTWEARFYDVANTQSVGACIQNMLLAATDLGYGSLWNCDIFFAYKELSEWLGVREQIVAAISFGFPAETPSARPRNNLAEMVEWK